jgi:hypothetical protein
MRRLTTPLVALLAWLQVIAPGVSAATYYVDQAHVSASDANAGTSEALPWLTFGRAMQADVVAGDTVYVKNGNYETASATGFNPINAGTSGSPIAYRAYTPPDGIRHAPVLSNTLPPSGVEASKAVIVFTNYTIWDGFRFGQYDSIKVQGTPSTRVVGTVLEELVIEPGPMEPAVCGQGNYAAVFLQLASTTTVRRNRISNVTYTDCDALNAVAVLQYDSDNATIRNNDISGSNTGLSDKENSVNTIFELNYVHDKADGYGIHAQGQDDLIRCGSATACPVTGLRYRNNVFENLDTAISLNLGDVSGSDSDIDAYNNTFVGVRVPWVGGNTAPCCAFYVTDIDVYNNIMVTNGSGASAGYQQIGLTKVIPADWHSNFNLHHYTAGGIRFRVPNGTGPPLFETLATWQARGAGNFDTESIAADPLFIGTPQGPRAYRLSAGSPAAGAGRIGGVPGGDPVNMGAYENGGECIGYPGGCEASSGLTPNPAHFLRSRGT